MRIWEFILAATLAEITPGPNMGYLAALALAHGRRAGLAAVAGVTLGLTLLGAVAAFGAGLAIQSHPLVFEGLRWAGVAYLLWLAWDTWSGEEDSGDGDIAPSFRRGLVVNLLNPKAGLFYVAVLPSFAGKEVPAISALLVLTAIYVLVATLVHTGVVVGASSLSDRLSRKADVTRLRRVSAILLACIALWLGWDTAR